MEIEIRTSSQIPKAELEQVSAWVTQIFSDDNDGLQWATDDWHVMVRLDRQVASRVGIVERMGTVNGQPVKLGGIGGVATLPAYRRRGLAHAAMAKAAEFMRNELKVEFGLLICGTKMILYYGRSGWQVVQGPMLFEQPKGMVTYTDTIMILPCTKNDWPSGIIDLCGLPW